MEIQKIFSEVDTDERLYSVLMSEEEYRLFSAIVKDITKVKIPDGTGARFTGFIGEQIKAAKRVDIGLFKKKSFSDDTESGPLNIAGKSALAGGAALGVAGLAGRSLAADQIANNMAKKYGLEKTGFGMGSNLQGSIDKMPKKNLGNIAKRSLGMNKGFKRATAAGIAGAGMAALGAGALIADKVMNKE